MRTSRGASQGEEIRDKKIFDIMTAVYHNSHVDDDADGQEIMVAGQ